MRLRGLVNLSLGLLMAGGAVAYTKKALEAPQQEVTMSPVLVARVEIPFGNPVERGMIEIQEWPLEAVPAGAFTKADDLIGDGKDGPRRARRAIAAGEVLLLGKMSAFGEKVTITELIEPSMRAVAVRVDDVTGVAGFVTPGDRVDIILTRTVDRSLRATTILQDIKVLGIDQTADKERDQPSVVKTVTVQVVPHDVQKLALAQQAGTLSLSLRNLETVATTRLETISVGDLIIEEEQKPAEAAAAEPSLSVLVNRRGERSRVEVPSG